VLDVGSEGTTPLPGPGPAPGPEPPRLEMPTLGVLILAEASAAEPGDRGGDGDKSGAVGTLSSSEDAIDGICGREGRELCPRWREDVYVL
jgi:hypothetical protein